LRRFYEYAAQICGSNVIDSLMGGSPTSVADRYGQGSPKELLPFKVQQVLIVGVNDAVMPPPARESYAAAARKAGDRIEVIEVPGSHFEVIAPPTVAFATVRDKVLSLVQGAK
jgi:hypothetical protein